ncbi:MAG TPA: prolipoprotein diacylglyceryl transferase [Gaiellaceae bacterium]|nr:prolipoprotein diacylglyceryl transferase [Gaiellaceae bacterium]
MIASIPSPSNGFFEIGPVTIHMYGLTLLLAIAVCIVVTGLRWTKRPGAAGGDWDLLLRIAVWGVAAGIVGARAYHVITSWSEVPDPKWQGVFEVWEGGLGVWGGIFLGTVVGAIVARRAGKSAFALMDAAAPGLLLAHGIGRFGNWWNQELFGKPTDLPWGLEIDPENRPFQYPDSETFQPTFLYEFIYVTICAGLLLLLDRLYRFKPPALFALYVMLYTFGRFFEELLRIDPSHEFAGLRLNAWVSIVVFVLATAFFVWWQFLRGRRPPKAARVKPPEGPAMAIPKGRVRR